VKLKAEYATVFDGILYLTDPVSIFPTVSISSYDLNPNKNDEEDGLSNEVLQSLGTKQIKIALDKLKFCEAVAPYLICTYGKKVSIVHLGNANVMETNFENEVDEISGTSSHNLSAAAFKGSGFVKIYKISQKQG